jgi:hypothetical protein
MGNKKYSLLSMVSSFLLLIFAIGSLVSINIDIAEVQNAPPAEGLDFRGLSVGLMTVVAVLTLIYGGIGLISALLKAVQSASGLWGFAIPAIFLDVVILVANGALLVNAVNEGELIGMIVSAAITLISFFSIAMSGKSIASRNES